MRRHTVCISAQRCYKSACLKVSYNIARMTRTIGKYHKSPICTKPELLTNEPSAHTYVFFPSNYIINANNSLVEFSFQCQFWAPKKYSKRCKYGPKVMPQQYQHKDASLMHSYLSKYPTKSLSKVITFDLQIPSIWPKTPCHNSPKYFCLTLRDKNKYLIFHFK